MGREGAGGGAWRWGVDWDGGAVPTTGRDQRGCGGSMGDLGASPFRAWKFRDTPIGPIVIDPLGGRGGGGPLSFGTHAASVSAGSVPSSIALTR